MYLIQQCFDFSLSSGFSIFEGVGFSAVEIGLSATWHEYARKTIAMSNGKNILKWCKTNRSERSMRYWMGHV